VFSASQLKVSAASMLSTRLGVMESGSFGFVVWYSMFLMQYIQNWLKLAFTRNNEHWPYILSHSGRFVTEEKF
jgi:hypothetical protein